jgi:hypothetical protein
MENLINQKRKGGRPKLDAFVKKSTPKTVRFTERGEAIVEAKAKMASMSVSDYIREMAENGEVKGRISVEDLAEIKKLNLIGNNLNQLAKLAHQYGYSDKIHAEFGELKDKINQVINQLITKK